MAYFCSEFVANEHCDNVDARVVASETAEANSPKHSQPDDVQRTAGPEYGEAREAFAEREALSEARLPKPRPELALRFPSGAQRREQRAQSDRSEA